ncbi:alpha/beta fold hydrolase [Streptosporangium pseudovulgare]|uniref:Alpha/beta hydrolase n=1 Tax=Streptosporangium pseudovulgare TaxID=35765 RepID=A0ABQ2QYP7_9ACTN|nr:alpha/beta fold hydrolase [Streptosporangium pseudovulgare]GGP99702.1 alpha/beta hydrolase [Streptosporangium pseudovulgare]
MRDARVRADGSRIRWVELPGAEPVRAFVHGLGASSAPYFTPAVTHPALSGHRTLMIDMLGFGISDRPADFGYTLEGHADMLAAALTEAGVGTAEVVAHSMGGAVATVLAVRHPHLVSALVLVDSNLDPTDPAPRPGSSGIAGYTEEDFLRYGWAETMERVGPHWAATMRLAGPEALHRSAVHLVRCAVPYGGATRTVRELLLELTIPRAFLHPEADGAPDGAAGLAAAGVDVMAVPDCGHNIMIDNVDGFAHAVAATLRRTRGAYGRTPGR